MNNLLPYCGLVDARMSASENNLPVRDKSDIRFLLTYLPTILLEIPTHPKIGRSLWKFPRSIAVLEFS